ncbi:Uma2 family endonuclease [Microbispora siamensis]
MSALPDGSWLLSIRPQPAPVTAEEYDALPEEIGKAIEIVDGYVVYRAAPTPDHQTADRRLANLLERYARAAMSKGHECLTVNNDVDLRLRDLPLLNRRPDVALKVRKRCEFWFTTPGSEFRQYATGRITFHFEYTDPDSHPRDEQVTVDERSESAVKLGEHSGVERIWFGDDTGQRYPTKIACDVKGTAGGLMQVCTA